MAAGATRSSTRCTCACRCKGCSNEYQVNVSDPHHEGRVAVGALLRRKSAAQGMGLIMLGAGGLACAGLANLVSQVAPLFDPGSRLPRESRHPRRMPPFARTTFALVSRTPNQESGAVPRCCLAGHVQRPFQAGNSHRLHPGPGSGQFPGLIRWLCCGRPLYDFGFLDLARHSSASSTRCRPSGRHPGHRRRAEHLAVFRDELDDPTRNSSPSSRFT